MAKLTKRAVDALEAPKAGQSYLWDGEIRGFGVRVVPSGLKTFVIQYRNAEDRSRRMKIGRYGIMTVEQARDTAKIKLGAVAAGEDPAAEAAKDRGDMTVSQLCDWYLEAAKTHRILGRRNRPIKVSTLKMDESRIETHIKPLLGFRVARFLTIADVEDMQADIVGGKTAKARGKKRGGTATGGPGVASRSVTTLQSILGHADHSGQLESHPTKGVRKLAGKKKERRLSVEEIVQLGSAIYLSERNGEHPKGLGVVRLLLLSGFRLNEAQGMEREWLNADGSFVAFPDTKGDAQLRAIGQAAVRVIEGQPQLRDNPHVFPSDVTDGQFTAAKSCLARVCALAEIRGVTPHTLRHTFGSVAGDLGFSELTIAALLGHAKQTVTQGYVHVDEALKLAVARTSDEIESLLAKGAGKVEIIERKAA